MISVGIDISKDKSTVCMLRPYGEVVEAPHDIEHNEQSLNALIERIKSFDEDVKVVLEATGGYHQVVVTKLLEADIFTVVVNPYIMKKYCAAALRKAKTDKIDSIRISNYGIDHWFSMTAYCPPDEIYAELKLLGRQYDQYVRLKINCKIQLANLLDGVMPGIKTILQGTVPAYSTKDKLTNGEDIHDQSSAGVDYAFCFISFDGDTGAINLPLWESDTTMELNGYSVQYSEKTNEEYAAEGITLGHKQNYHGYAVFTHNGYTYYLSTNSENADFFDSIINQMLTGE